MGGRSRSAAYLVLSVACGALFVVGAATPALAHNSLVSSDPRNGARLTKAPAAVRLTFLAKLDPRATQVTITDPAGTRAEAGRPAVDGRTVTVALRTGPAGQYTVAYQVPSSDGHPVRGKVRFTLTAGASPSAFEAFVESPAASPAARSTTASQDDGGAPWWPWTVAGAALAATAGFFVARRNRG